MKIDIDKIIIPDIFKQNAPNEQKVEMKRAYYNKHHAIKKPLQVNENNILLDGYISYLLLKEVGYSGEIEVDVVYRSPVPQSYVWGKHPGNKKIYVWKCPDHTIYKKGDFILVDTIKGPSMIRVENVGVLYYPPVDRKIRTVITL